MYPNLYYACKDLFNIDIPFLHSIHTAGFFIALAFIAAAWFWENDLRRLQRIGLVTAREQRQGRRERIVNLQKEGKAEPKLEWPGDLTPWVTVLAALFALAGSKIFAMLESPATFLRDPVGMLLSTNGFAFYGGLTAAFIAMWIYHRKWGDERFRIVDALVPSLMVGYAVGRLGCHLSGDGDWGIYNRATKPLAWIPDWLWASRYPHNVVRDGIYMKGCDWGIYCYQLPLPVFPTPLYEFAGASLFFLILWWLRKKITTAGRLTAIYMVLMGSGRFLIEKIRVNAHYRIGNFDFTQAELISLLFVAAGLILYAFAPALRINKPLQRHSH